MPHKDHDKMLAAQARWREKNREKLRQSYRDYYAEHAPEMREKSRKRKEADPEKRRDSDRRSGKKFRDNLRQSVIAFFGGKCVRCGFDDCRALQVDHINGGGTRERKSVRNNQAIYKAILVSDPVVVASKYQLMCANCNQIKRHEQGEHRRVGQ